MIREKKRKTKYNYIKTPKQVLFDYIRTIGRSILIAIIITSALAYHARNEMIKDIYSAAAEQSVLDKKIAEQLILRSKPLENLQDKTYPVCMHTGELYDIVGDYEHAQIAYELAVEKASPGNFKPHYKLICALVAQEKFDKVDALLDNVKDYTDKTLIKFKTRSYLTIGDKYYSIGKSLSAAKSYEKAKFYYDKFTKKDKVVEKSILNRIIKAYINTADIMVKTGLNTDAARYLKKAEAYAPENYIIRYKLAIVLSDSDPEQAVKYLEPLLEEIPQEIDYNVYGSALMKAANIADLEGRHTQAKYYRYRIHSIDMFVNRKVIYKNDLDIDIDSFIIKKSLFTYPIKATFNITNNSSIDLVNLYADFVLTQDDKAIETVTQKIASKNKPLFAGTFEPSKSTVTFKKKTLTKKELKTYTIKIYTYKDEKYKTLATEIKIPDTSIYSFK